MEELSLPASLREANLSGNRIRTIAPGTLKQKSNLAKVDLTENLIKQLALPALAVELSDAEGMLCVSLDVRLVRARSHSRNLGVLRRG